MASQTVLEGLNACLDHRGEVYIAELDQVFKRHPDFKLFAAQNPHHQGGGRKGLPSSFVNRFIVVYADVFTKQDLLHITAKKFDKIGAKTQQQLIEFMSRLDDEVVSRRSFGALGSPWEFNLRDTLRWGELLTSQNALLAGRKPDDYLDVIIRQRFRMERDRQEVNKLFTEIFERAPDDHGLYHDINAYVGQIGLASLKRNPLSQPTAFPAIDPVPRLKEIESIIIAIEQDLPCILVGPSGSGKSALLAHVAALAGKPLVIFPLNADVDAMDLIGGFEQADPHREVQACLSKLKQALQDEILRTLPNPVPSGALDLMAALHSMTGGAHQFEGILRFIEGLQGDAIISETLAALLSDASEVLRKPLTLENPRFEWLDGVIVRAVETGAWLVLDNANLCSASVLDRLNSLLERPNGILSINEHSGPGGEPRIIKPHPDFRIFLTVDPRYGELSRAMRNRSIEIYLDALPVETAAVKWIAPVDGSLQRFHAAAKILGQQAEDGQIVPLSFDILSLDDSNRLDSYLQAAREGLTESSPALVRSPAAVQHLAQLLSYIQSEDASALRQSIAALYAAAPNRMLMPMHPLVNSPVLQLLEQSHEGLAFWLASCYEFYLDIQSLEKVMEVQLGKVNVSKPSSMNRLQRSWVSDKVASLSRDSTANAVRFLHSVLRTVKSFICEKTNQPGAWKQRRAVLRRLLLFWKRTFESLIVTSFEEARFQAHLTQGSNLLLHNMSALQEADDHKLFSALSGFLERDFVVGFKLSTGLSMEVLWHKLRPDPIADLQTLEQATELERLADRFDSLRWRVGVSISTLRTIQDSMARVYAIIRTGKGDAASLVKDLESEISTLESKIGEHSTTHQPFFASSFEGLRQALILHQVSQGTTIHSGSSDVDVLSSLPTASLMRLQCLKQTALQAVDYILAQDTSDIHPWEGTLSKSLLLKYDAASSASLNELRSLEVEMPIMGKTLASASEALATDPLVKAEELLLKLMDEVMGAHDQSFKGQIAAAYQSLVSAGGNGLDPDTTLESLLAQADQFGVPGDHLPQHVNVILGRHFAKALLALAASAKGFQPRSASTSVAWVRFALGCVELFVPDKIFDPHHRAQIEAEEHQELYESLQKQIAALDTFELAFTGQRTSLRSQLLVEETEGLGQPPAVQSIYRPGGGELRGLQGEFNNVLNALIGNDVSATHLRSLVSETAVDAAEELALVEQNVGLLITRLTTRYGAYQDLTMPLVSFIRCLRMGLSLGRGLGSSKTVEDGDLQVLVSVTPFLSGTIWKTETADFPLRSLEFLSYVQAVATVDGLDKLPVSLRRSLHESLAVFHEEWTKKLEADRKIEESKTSLFRFKGSLEDQEEYDQEDFDQLFPDYTPDEDGVMRQKKPRRGGRELSVMLAEAHGKIFLSTQEAQQSIKSLCTQVARRIAREKRESAIAEPELDRILLPATMLVFEEQEKAFGSNVDGSNYNFYTDANLAEVRKALGLVNSIKKRFLELQGIDEIGHHQTLADVVMACDKVLEVAIDDPLARIITAIERLHAHVYEWHEGGWATKAHKATALYEKLRDTICDWRRLELSSWSRLLDEEVKKNYEDAKSWWFIAYGAVILEPCSILQQGEDLKGHAVKLLGILESYFTSATVGQFAARLDLLKQLKNQLDLLVMDEPTLGLVSDAVQNFITFYRRYERTVTETIRAGRAPLDRSMKDVLLMSKWRDKNIDALRESARKSHQKLFKLVRKFRAVLEQPVQAITNQGLPDEDHSNVTDVDCAAKLGEAHVDRDAIVLCQQVLPGIESHPHWGRMSNLPAVLKAMSKHGSLPATTINAAETLDNYISDLVASITSLRKETPGTLTDENKELVRHLKTRKITLYSDTLKTLRAMGFSRNLGTNLLEKQSSTAVVLVGSGVVRLQGTLDAVEYFYHKTLDLAPRFRQATFDHSEDLNREVVHRSIGYLEGVLHVMFRQRQFLARASKAERGLHATIDFVKELSAGGDASFNKKERATNHAQVVRWLVQIIKLGVHLVEVHGKLGGVDNGEIRSTLEGWVETFTKLDTARDSLPNLPVGFSSVGGDKLQGDVDRELDALRNGLEEIAQTRPDLAFVVQQIQLWTSIQATELINGVSSDADINSFAAAALTLSSKILVALQNFQKAAQSLPTTTEDAGWLIQYSDNLQQSIDALRMTRIAEEVESLISQLKTLSTTTTITGRPAASAFLRLIYPILAQYSSACTRNLAQFIALHRTTCRLGYHLSASFVQISAQGFCTPQEKSDEQSGESGNVESGTGLGEGEGAEDISKDIKPDEDLSELAQDPNNKAQGEIEENKDAVDMGDDELEGELGSVGGEDEEDEEKKGDKDGEEDEEEDDDMEEQAGDVDDLDPTAVDEKMWDGSGEEDAEKEQQGDQEKGRKDDDQSAAAEGEKKEQQQQKVEENEDGNAPPDEAGEQGDEDEEAEGEPGQEEEGMPQEELNHQDQNVQENETLALPEDMEIEIDDGEEQSEDEDDDLDGLSDVEKPEEKQADAPEDMDQSGEEEERGEEEHQKDENIQEEEAEQEEEIDAAGDREEEMDVDMQEEEEGGEEGQEEKDETKPPLPDDGTGADQENAAPSDVQNGGGQAEDANMQDDEVENKAGQREQGALSKQSAEEDKAPGNQGALSSLDQEQGPSDKTEDVDSKEAQPFKKLGDALERWYRNQRDIQAASEDQEKTEKPAEDMSKAEFQHLQDETAEADAQALGTATNEEAKPMDDAMAIDTEMDEGKDQIMPEEEEKEEEAEVDVEMENVEPSEQQDTSKKDREDGRSGVATHKGAYETDDKEDMRRTEASPEDVDDEQIQETSTQLLATHITEHDEEKPLRDYSEALEMWSSFQTKTQGLSQSLSSQLRLILTPTQSTKLSGSFRTGKRLNIKKIIPYIASSYKRDKIWMRRAIPSKRAYQILLCVDDSSSMAESGDATKSSSGSLALESLVMVARALTVLEAGQIGVLGFGTDVFVAHALTDPSFTSHDTGARVLQKFTFNQDGTDMVRLLRRTIDHFREARLMQASSPGGEELWQLALILSDGLVQSRDHAKLRPLLREAMEQRVMVVFIVMDDARGGKKGHSVLELKEARFGPDGVPVIHRYLDSFPFPYYLIVHHLEDLPGALAGLLRSWFAEVNS